MGDAEREPWAAENPMWVANGMLHEALYGDWPTPDD